MGGDHRAEETFPQEPGTPPPLSGRKHCVMQTEIYLENIADSEIEFKNAEMQCEDLHDDVTDASAEPIPIIVEKKGTTTIGTQLHEWVFSNIGPVYDEISINLADCVIMESLKQLQEEFELEALRKQHQMHKDLRLKELAILAKYKDAQAKYEAQKRYLDTHKSWDEDVDGIIAKVGLESLQNNAPTNTPETQTDEIYAQIHEQFVPSLNNEIPGKLKLNETSHELLRAIIEETVVKREVEYSGISYFQDGDQKRSLAVGNLSEYEYDLDEDGVTMEM